MKQVHDLRAGDNLELEAMMECRGWILLRSRIDLWLKSERNSLETVEGQSHPDMEGRRRCIGALRDVLAMPKAIIREYEEERAAGAFGEQGED